MVQIKKQIYTTIPKYAIMKLLIIINSQVSQMQNQRVSILQLAVCGRFKHAIDTIPS